jgi:hypothetical protein
MSAGFSNATVYLKCDSVVFAYYACAVKIVSCFFFENTKLVQQFTLHFVRLLISGSFFLVHSFGR